MAVLEVRTYPNEVLRKKALPVESVDDETRRLMDDMVETMYARAGLGLAAPQVGVSKRVVVVHVAIQDGPEYPLTVIANPELVSSGGSMEFEEGCLSLPGFTTVVKRPSEVVVKGLDRDGKEITIKAEGMFAVVLQHEMDHLDGILILDRAGSIKREFYKKRLKKSLAKAG